MGKKERKEKKGGDWGKKKGGFGGGNPLAPQLLHGGP